MPFHRDVSWKHARGDALEYPGVVDLHPEEFRIEH